MLGFFLVMKAELVRAFIIMRRYWFATIISLLMGYGMLITMVIGLMQLGRNTAVQEMAQGAINGILGFLVGIFAFGIVGMFTQGVQGMAQTGELEQVCLSPYGLVTNFLARSFVAALNTIISSSIMLILVAETVARGTLHVAPLETVILLLLTYINLIGFGFLVGGLVLVVKQVGQVAMIIRFSMIGLAIFATDKLVEWPAYVRWLAHAVPITDAAICLKYTLIQGQMRPILDPSGAKIIEEIRPVMEKGQQALNEAGQPIMETIYQMQGYSVFAHESFWFLLVSCVLWTTIGIACFKFMENWSRSRGTIGAY